MRYNPEKDINS